MADQTEFLMKRVEQEQALADAATLENVRQSHLRSVKAWTALAERAARGDVVRAQDAARKAERDAERDAAESAQAASA